MKISSKNITNDHIADAFCHHGTQFEGTMPSRSLQLSWSDLPKETVSLAIFFDDLDAIPVCGFSWIHWVVANIDPFLGELPENASLEMPLLEGINSWASPIIPAEWKLSVENAAHFGGCAPPEKTHFYTLKMYALDKKLDLKRGFFANMLFHEMRGHVLDEASLNFWCKAKSS
ncbi:MAG: YbhB/YbcL family Raf kinase inhibitor-like protein [Gammaproteobacteria bacterium]|jgi:Raf kinase inhibitor-like YbhB/YbcL family protein|nr:YbhB/YbcL family Raf kinase inhibitor-like protein [Gammaproteobacteria bacterium]